ncbi:MAG TPA: integrase core domain-containing protein [Spongiibacteraceae bacterium]|nr:integrase core domain-containing protein [Spongiibacteraceae bacterium]
MRDNFYIFTLPSAKGVLPIFEYPKVSSSPQAINTSSISKIIGPQKHQLLFISTRKNHPGQKGPSDEIIAEILEIKHRNPRFGCPRIAPEIAHAFGIEINKDVVRRVLEKLFRSRTRGDGPSWLSLIGQTKDSLWSVDFFRRETILLRSYVVMVVMDVFTRRIIGCGVEPANIDGMSVCRMFNHATSKHAPPRYLSSDNDPLFLYHRWRANLRVLGIHEIKSVPYTPTSHRFVERLIGTVRREFIDHAFFWNRTDLQRKLDSFKQYYNDARVHS